MNWEQRFCPNPVCTDEAWMVQRDPATCDIWWVAAQVDDRPFCPRCGTTLHTRVELEGRLAGHLGAEVGPVFDFVRSVLGGESMSHRTSAPTRGGL